MGQAPGVVVIPRVGSRLVQKAGDPCPLIPVAVGKAQLLLPEVTVFI